MTQKIKNCCTEIYGKARDWWTENHPIVGERLRTLAAGFVRIGRNIVRFIVIGIILNVISAYFWPEFPERFPVLYGWFDGWLQLGELAYKGAIGSVYSLFTGNFSEFWNEYTVTVNVALNQFVSWLASISF